MCLFLRTLKPIWFIRFGANVWGVLVQDQKRKYYITLLNFCSNSSGNKTPPDEPNTKKTIHPSTLWWFGLTWLLGHAAFFRHTRRSFDRFSIITSMQPPRWLRCVRALANAIFLHESERVKNTFNNNNSKNMRRLLSVRRSCVILLFWLRVVRHIYPFVSVAGVCVRECVSLSVAQPHPYLDATAQFLRTNFSTLLARALNTIVDLAVVMCQ